MRACVRVLFKLVSLVCIYFYLNILGQAHYYLPRTSLVNRELRPVCIVPACCGWLTWLDHALLRSHKNESSFYCKLHWNDLKTKQTKRTCSIYSLLLTHFKEHTDLPSLTPQNGNVFRMYFWTTFSLNILGKTLWRVLLQKHLWASNFGLKRHTFFFFFSHQTLTGALSDRPRSFCLDSSTYWPSKLPTQQLTSLHVTFLTCKMGIVA